MNKLTKDLRTVAMDLREPNIIAGAVEHQAKKLEQIADELEKENGGKYSTNVSGAGTGQPGRN